MTKRTVNLPGAPGGSCLMGISSPQLFSAHAHPSGIAGQDAIEPKILEALAPQGCRTQRFPHRGPFPVPESDGHTPAGFGIKTNIPYHTLHKKKLEKPWEFERVQGLKCCSLWWSLSFLCFIKSWPQLGVPFFPRTSFRPALRPILLFSCLSMASLPNIKGRWKKDVISYRPQLLRAEPDVTRHPHQTRSMTVNKQGFRC